ncbi:MAG: MBL fold metallo-hydrolase [Planctomycetota bacterium]
MKIDRLVLGEFETNCYVLRSDKQATECLIIDTGLDVGPLLAFLEQHKLSPDAVVLTHGHIDHIAGVDTLRTKFPTLSTYIHKLDAELLTDAVGNLSFMTGESVSTGKADHLVEEPDIIERAGIKLRVIHTPGHTSGGICLYAEQNGILFVGDTLFAGSIGRTDFPGGDMEKLIEGIKQKLLVLPDKTVVYPGHGPQTTIKREKTHNPFLH